MDMEDVLYYWPLPFRANFICLILEEVQTFPYRWASAKEVIDLKDRPIKDQLSINGSSYFFDSHENILFKSNAGNLLAFGKNTT